MEIETLLRHIDLGEDQNIEFKAADGGLPKDLWRTLSAFANTDGGYIVLGVSEKQGKLEISGVSNPQALQTTFWNTHNNREKLNTPICSDVEVKNIDGYNLLIINIPKATPKQRPVYINNNPMTGTYKRSYEGDYLCSKEEIQQMLRDASNDAQDSKILDGFDFKDLDLDTLKSFRQRFSSRDPDHPWLAKDDQELLYQLGGWKRDRKTGKEGLTIAGLLMFGRERSILDAFSHYQLDYQEHLSNDPEERWTYRLTLDGKWEPNLFNFYYRVYLRLVDNLDVPFKLDKDSVRKGETHVHEALREALVNTLIHADHQSSRPIKIIKELDCFHFSNPGFLRIPLESLYKGGISDPRNPNLQKMFQMLGLGEKAGSGFQKILRAWEEQQWFIPLVSEKSDIGVTKVTLQMMSFIPEDVEREIKKIVGDDYCNLTELDCIIFALAHQFGEISNFDIQRYRKEHPRDISEHLRSLVQNGWLSQAGRGRGTRYTLLNNQFSQPSLFSSSEHLPDSSEHLPDSSEHLPDSSEHLPDSSEHLPDSSEHLPDSSEHLLDSSEHLPDSSEHLPDSSEHLLDSSEHYERLKKIAEPIREKGSVKKELVEDVILQLCCEQYLLLRTLAELLGREPDSIRNHYLNPLLDRGVLELKHPKQKNHPQQAYRTVSR
jgi:ATP-dependent DNA helicase RecG